MTQVAPRIVNQDHSVIRTLRAVGVASRQFGEDWLQELLFAEPGLLPIHEIDQGFTKLVPLARELSVTAGAIDLIYATPQGRLCLVETKLWRNPEAHRSVLSQTLDYVKDLVRMDFEMFKQKIESAAGRNGRSVDLFKMMQERVGAGNFDSITFQATVSNALQTGNLLLLIVGDRIRPEVAMLSNILGTAPNLEFTIALIEIAFYHLETGDWPILAVPSVVGKSHEVTRAVVKIRYEQKQPEVEVTAEEKSDGGTSRTDMEAFLGSLPAGLAEIFRPYLEGWLAAPFILYWGTAGFSLRYAPQGKAITIIDAQPTYISLFKKDWLSQWENPVQAYQEYLEAVNRIPEVRRVNGENRRYVRFDRLTLDDMRLLLEATNRLARELVVFAETEKKEP